MGQILESDYSNHDLIEYLTAGNGETVSINLDNGKLWDSLGRYGYYSHFGGLYVCYTCGHLCECYETEEV